MQNLSLLAGLAALATPAAAQQQGLPAFFNAELKDMWGEVEEGGLSDFTGSDRDFFAPIRAAKPAQLPEQPTTEPDQQPAEARSG